jgi:hypothetical protein
MTDQEITRTSDQIAILGWGSLLWDAQNNRYFDALHGPWMLDGPELQLEFSRKSQTRSGALTLVIDPKHGASSRVAYAISTRSEPQAAVNDLRRREGTTSENIGRFFGDDSTLNRCKSASALGAIGAWAKTKGIDVVLWTDLGGDFDAIEPGLFVPTAVKYCASLTADGKAKAVEYVSRAPDFVRTPLKDELEREAWFREKLKVAQGSKAERGKSQ